MYIQNDWYEKLEGEFQKPYFLNLQKFLDEEYENSIVYPHRDDIFNALQATPYHQVKVVLLGQDPYHGEGQAHGLSFSVPKGVKIPPSLKNIFKELHDDLGVPIPEHGCLQSWAKEGVLLLNTVLTVRAGKANSHRGKGWEVFTDKVITCLNEREDGVIFLLWGNDAKKKIPLINQKKHVILTSSHPSPLSAHRGFFGSKPFSKVNAILEEWNKEPIHWTI